LLADPGRRRGTGERIIDRPAQIVLIVAHNPAHRAVGDLEPAEPVRAGKTR
jgi:hypothetical protein